MLRSVIKASIKAKSWRVPMGQCSFYWWIFNMGPYLTAVGVFGLEFADIFKWAHLDYIVSDVRSIYPP